MTKINIGEQFNKYFEIVLADNDQLKAYCYRIRYDVYCVELGFEEPVNFPDCLERDEFDKVSHHYLLRHKSSGQFAGTIRLVDTVLAQGASANVCPFEYYCLDSITDPALHPRNFNKHAYCEVSRLAVPASFRRRSGEQGKPYILEGNRVSITMEEQKTFPYIAVGLYLAAAAHFVNSEHLDHIYVMMERRLARHLQMVGIHFKQIGRVMDYHGERAAFHVDEHRLLGKMSANVMELYKSIESSVVAQLSSGTQGTKVATGL